MIIVDQDNEEIVFSSGRTHYTYTDVIGIGATNDVHYGADGSIDWPRSGSASILTAEDMRELADLMIWRWKRFRESLE